MPQGFPECFQNTLNSQQAKFFKKKAKMKHKQTEIINYAWYTHAQSQIHWIVSVLLERTQESIRQFDEL